MDEVIQEPQIDKPDFVEDTKSTVKNEKSKKTNEKSSVFDQSPTSIFSNKSKLYKLNLYRPNGNFRAEIGKASYTELARNYGDIIHSLPSNKWSTMDEICNYVWLRESKSYLKSFTRSRKQIEDGISFGIDIGAILSK